MAITDTQSYAKFEAKVAKKFIKTLEKNFGKATDKKREFVLLIGTEVFRDVIDHFKKEEGKDGPWEEWSDSYEEYMSKIGKGGNNLLQDKGRLRQAFTPAKYALGQGGIVWFNPAKVKSFPYAYAHNEGGSILPKREFMWLSNNALEGIAKKTLQFILGK